MGSKIEQLAKTHPSIKKDGSSFIAGFDDLYVEPGFNIRDIDKAHVVGFYNSWKNNVAIQPILVEVINNKLRVVDGHHRYYGYRLAKIQDASFSREIHVIEFEGTEVEKISAMITSSESKHLTITERAGAYGRMLDAGASVEEIANYVHKPESHVESLLVLHKFISEHPKYKILVELGIISTTMINSHVKAHDKEAGKILSHKIDLDNLDLDSISVKPDIELPDEQYQADMEDFQKCVEAVKKQVKDSLSRFEYIKVPAKRYESLSTSVHDLAVNLAKTLQESTGKTLSISIERPLAMEIVSVAYQINEAEVKNREIKKNRIDAGIEKPVKELQVKKTKPVAQQASTEAFKDVVESVADDISIDVDLQDVDDLNIDPMPDYDSESQVYGS